MNKIDLVALNFDDDSDAEEQADDDSPVYFSASITDGYSFRSLIDYLRTTNLSGKFVFSSTSITYVRGNTDGSIVNQVVLFPSEFIEYNYHPHNVEFEFSVNLSRLRQAVKSVAKRESIRIFKNKKSKLVTIQPVGKSKGKNPVYAETINDEQKYILPDVVNRKPNFSVSVSDFCTMGVGMNIVKSSYVIFMAKKFGMSCTGYFDSDKESNRTDLGFTGDVKTTECNGDIDNEFIGEYKVGITMIKAMSKISNMNPSGIIKIYLFQNGPMVLSTNVSNYGRINIYLKYNK